MPGLRIGWAVGPETFIHGIWERHDYTTLTPGMASDILAAVAMEPVEADGDLRAHARHHPRSSPS